MSTSGIVGPFFTQADAHAAKPADLDRYGLYRVEKWKVSPAFPNHYIGTYNEFYWLSGHRAISWAVTSHLSVHVIFYKGSLCRLPLDIDIKTGDPSGALERAIAPNGSLTRLMDAWGRYLSTKNSYTWCDDPCLLKWQFTQTCRLIDGKQKLSIHGCTVGAVPVKYMPALMFGFIAFVRAAYPDADSVLMGVDEQIFGVNLSLRIGRHTEYGDYLWPVVKFEHDYVHPISARTVESVAYEMRACGSVVEMAEHDCVDPYTKIMRVDKKRTVNERELYGKIAGTWLEDTHAGYRLMTKLRRRSGSVKIVRDKITGEIRMWSDFCVAHDVTHSSNKVTYTNPRRDDTLCHCFCRTETIGYTICVKRPYDTLVAIKHRRREDGE